MHLAEVVVITGASAGVGRATALAFAARRAHVGLLAREPNRLEQTKREVEAAGGRAIAIPTDVADADQVEAAARAVERAFGPIDIWINNAMASVFSPVMEMRAEEFARVTDVTYLGTVHGTLAALRRMVPRDHGAIVQVGSALAYRGIPIQAAYCAAKHAVQGFCESVRTELLHDRSRVRVTMVQLPALNTPQFDWVRNRQPGRAVPLRPIFQPEVAARAILWAAHHDRREVNVGWQTVKAILANRLVPALTDRYLARNGYSQHTGEPEPPRADNLFAPVPGDPGAHGRFDRHAKRHCLQFWLTSHRKEIAMCGALALTAILGARHRTVTGALRPASMKPSFGR